MGLRAWTRATPCLCIPDGRTDCSRHGWVGVIMRLALKLYARPSFALVWGGFCTLALLRGLPAPPMPGGTVALQSCCSPEVGVARESGAESCTCRRVGSYVDSALPF